MESEAVTLEVPAVVSPEDPSEFAAPQPQSFAIPPIPDISGLIRKVEAKGLDAILGAVEAHKPQIDAAFKSGEVRVEDVLKTYLEAVVCPKVATLSHLPTELYNPLLENAVQALNGKLDAEESVGYALIVSKLQAEESKLAA